MVRESREHEIRNFVTVVTGAVDLLDVRPDEAKAILRHAVRHYFKDN